MRPTREVAPTLPACYLRRAMQPHHEQDLPEGLWNRLLAREPAAAAASPLYGPLLGGEPLVLGRLAQSLDGRIATESGKSFWISGTPDIVHTHRLRALFDVVVVGAGTVRGDDPQLTTRHCAGPSPARAIVDAGRRLSAEYRVFRNGPPTWLICAEDAGGPEQLGAARVLRVARAADGTGLDPAAMLAALAGQGLTRVIVEGGGVTVSRFLAAGCLDRLHLTLAPLLLGSGVPGVTLPVVAQPGDGMRVSYMLHRLGADLLLDIPLTRAAA